MDNWHLFIILSLIAFGTGHAVFRARIGFWTFMLLVIFLVPLLFVYERSEMYILILTNVVLGFLFAHRQVVIDVVEDVREGIGQFLGFFKRLIPEGKPKPTPEPNTGHSEASQSSNTAWQEEQARREQEVKAKREQVKQEQQQEKQKENKQEKRKQSGPEPESQESYSNTNPPASPPPPKDQRTPLEVLGLHPGFTPQELKQAYSRESARCHPDKWVGKPEAIRQMMEEEQKLINSAYQKLK